MVVSDELRSRSIEEGASSGRDEPETAVDVERGDGRTARMGWGVGGMRIRDGASIRRPVADECQRQGV